MFMRAKLIIALALTIIFGFVLTADDGGETIKDLAAQHSTLIGAGVTRGKLRNATFKELLLKHHNTLTPENELKMDALRRNKGKFNWKPADSIINFGAEQHMKMRGHTLVWHSAVPTWLPKIGLNKAKVMEFIKEHIKAVVGRYKGKLIWWDVVNEVFEDNGKLRTSSSFWYQTCGEEYIEKAFFWAHEADPQAMLFINDYGVEQINPKSTATYNLVKKFLEKEVPIHGFGMQAHMTEGPLPDFKSIESNIKRFIDLGLEVHFTELDVRILGSGNEKQFKRQAEIYRGFLELAKKYKQVTCVTFWGISDADSWIPGVFQGYDSALLFSRRYEPKPAFFAVLEALKDGK
jgi:endo-1,4-beta-xylanase